MQEAKYIEHLLDFADEIVRRLEGSEVFGRGSYLMTLVYIEDILDKYGRGSEWIGWDEQYRFWINERLEKLRSAIYSYAQTDEFQEAKRAKMEQFDREWPKG